LDAQFFPTHHTAQIVLPQISISLEPSKMPCVGKGLGVITSSLKKWLQVQISVCYKKGVDALVSCWCKAVKVDGDYVEKLGV
jgi:hypothetical protein